MADEKRRVGQLVNSLAQSGARGRFCLGHVPDIVHQLVTNESWRDFIIPDSGEIVKHKTFLGFVTSNVPNGLEISPEVLKALCVTRPEVIAMIDRELGTQTASEPRLDAASAARAIAKRYTRAEIRTLLTELIKAV